MQKERGLYLKGWPMELWGLARQVCRTGRPGQPGRSGRSEAEFLLRRPRWSAGLTHSVTRWTAKGAVGRGFLSGLGPGGSVAGSHWRVLVDSAAQTSLSDCRAARGWLQGGERLTPHRGACPGLQAPRPE